MTKFQIRCQFMYASKAAPETLNELLLTPGSSDSGLPPAIPAPDPTPAGPTSGPADPTASGPRSVGNLGQLNKSIWCCVVVCGIGDNESLIAIAS